MGLQGIEPRTAASSVRCSTTELNSLKCLPTWFINHILTFSLCFTTLNTFMGVEEYIKKIVTSILINAGYSNADKQALDLLTDVFIHFINENLKILSTSAQHSGRVNLTMFDFVKQKNKLFKFDDNVLPCYTLNDYLQHEQLVIENEWDSPLATKSEKFIHIYDFMPDFPAIHAFRNTPGTENREHFESTNVKNKMEQSIKSEKNMFKLFKTSGSLPAFINCMYKNIEESNIKK